ncbi:uncharacterized protein LOC130898694 [Diorhabda carinulata]|uniref:uncharacterized protein LOC130898694 n=1 Tax=Diorhabda carinulata TaxID=1163345 RepID=UPI0025A0AD5B|nr:uncharacterized protein LOC130898694 [Diorhabda carinulata]
MFSGSGIGKIDKRDCSSDVRHEKEEEDVTDDPLATIKTDVKGQKIYSVSRSVVLPRLYVENCNFPSDDTSFYGGGVNPLFLDSNQKHYNNPRISARSREKSTSSGYGDSNTGSVNDPYQEQHKLVDEVGVFIEKNPAFVRSIKISTRGIKSNKTVPFHATSAGDTLTTIPEGKIDLTVPKPIWPIHDKKLLNQYDSIVDDALLLYTSLNYHPENTKNQESYIDMSLKDLLFDILSGINETLEGRNTTPPENLLKIIDEKIRTKFDNLRLSTEEELKRLCVNLTHSRTKNSVLKALSHSTSSRHSGVEDVYDTPSRSSSSGFSDRNLPVFVHDNLFNAPNIVRNALIYGTICRTKTGSEGLLKKSKKIGTFPKKNLLSNNDGKPSVWEQYYGVKAINDEPNRYPRKPTDVPVYPVGRPEADFTLDMPRSEHLLRRMENDKKWRCRCRLLTSFFGLIFFLLSVMVVSLVLTRGRRMFGSMV